MIAYSEGEAKPQSVLSVLTCGSVDDGKSTLLGRLFLDTGAILPDQMRELSSGIAGDVIDVSRLFDGLEAEREQGITIDVSYRRFATPHRIFRLLDAPGHEQYTRNMATAASGASAALLLVDVRKGIGPQTIRHAAICDLFGVEELVLIVNKMDLVEWSEMPFRRLVSDFRTKFEGRIQFRSFSAIPVSALTGDNVVNASLRMPWWRGQSLLSHLEQVAPAAGRAEQAFRMPVQLVEKLSGSRHYLGTVGSGTVRTGEVVNLLPSGRQVAIKTVSGPNGPIDKATSGDAIVLELEDELDLQRGDVITSIERPATCARAIRARIVWFGEAPLIPERIYFLRIGTQLSTGAITRINHRIDLASGERVAARSLSQNEIADCDVTTASEIVFDSFRNNPTLGSFIIIDRATYDTVGAGVIDGQLSRAGNLFSPDFAIDKNKRAILKAHSPAVVWLTGLSGSGKSTIANEVEKLLWAANCHTILLDGDNLRQGLNRDLSFTDADRVENIRRIGEVSKLMLDAGLIVICSFISPFGAERQMVRELVDDNEFIEVFVKTPLDICIERDPKGLYARALAGQIESFTGLTSAYEEPTQPDLVLDTVANDAVSLANTIVGELKRRGIVA